MTLIFTIEIHVLRKRTYLTYSAIKVVYTAFTLTVYTCTRKRYLYTSKTTKNIFG